MQEHRLLVVRQHISKYVFRLPKWVGSSLIGAFITYIVTDSAWIASGMCVGILSLGLMLEWHRFTKSMLVVTNLRVYLSVMKGVGSGFEAGLHYRQIKNCAFRKEHILHTLTRSGTLYLRAGGDEKEQIAAEYVPEVEHICRVINWLLALPEEKRASLERLPEGI